MTGPTTSSPIHRKRARKPFLRRFSLAVSISTQQAWQKAYDSKSHIDLDDDSLNVHFAYDDDDAHRSPLRVVPGCRHCTKRDAALHASSASRPTLLWALGSEDNSLWKIWDSSTPRRPCQRSRAAFPPGYEVDAEGEGDVLHITRKPQIGSPRPAPWTTTTLFRHATGWSCRSRWSRTLSRYTIITSTAIAPKRSPSPSTMVHDSEWTPKILDVLEQYDVKGVFLLIGEEAEKNVGIMQRIYREGHEIGNHSFTHPDIAEVSKGTGRS